MTVVAIARVLLPAGLEPLRERAEVREGGHDATPAQVREIAAGADVLVADPTVAVDAALLDAAGPQLRLVANFAVGYDNVDLEVCRQRGIAVTNTPDVLTNATAELALALTLAAARFLSEAERDLRAGRWRGWDPAAYRGLELSGATVGVVGTGPDRQPLRGAAGRIRGRAALHGALAPSREAESRLGAARAELEELLRRSDVVSLHAPGEPRDPPSDRRRGPAADAGATRSWSTRRAARWSTSTPSRRRCREGSLGAAGLDVYEGEPEVPSEILEAPRAVLAPHIGSATVKARDAMARTVAENVIAVLDGREPPNRVA